MELYQLRYFVAVAESGSVSRAATRCHITQPSLSQQLKKLEEYLGVRLLDRLGRGIALTDAGKALLPRARRLLSDARDTEANIKREADGGHGTLIIGAIPTLAPYLLPPALKKVRASHAQCEVSVREDLTENLVEALEDNEIDCALVSTPLENELLEVEVIGEEELLLALPPTRAAKAKEAVTLSELRNLPTIRLEGIHCLGRQIQGFCSTRRLAPRVVCRTTQLSTIIELVALGVGVSIIPEMAAAADRSRRCRYVRLRPAAPSREIAVAWRQGRTRPLAAVRFVESVAANLRLGVHSFVENGLRRSRDS
jgi:LysR family hydrogen peroxide-inducible transcriptional activator